MLISEKVMNFIITFNISSIFYIIAILGLSLFIKKKVNGWIGRSGEKFVNRKLHELDPSYYKILEDIMLPSKGNTLTTQIDFVVVSNYGIFCIEAKALEGWIYGNTNDKYWTQVIFRYKKRFYNPIRQNFAHIKALEDLVGSQRIKAPIVSLIVFMDADKLIISGTDTVSTTQDTISKIQSFTNMVYSDTERDEICNLITQTNITDKELRKSHNSDVRELKEY